MDAGSGRERIGVVWLVLLALAALGGLSYVLATQSTRSVDAAKQLSAWFDARELPERWKLADAQVLPRGDVTVRFEPAVPAEEAPRNAVSEAEEPSHEPFDWSTVPVGESGSQPREVLIVELPLEGASAELEPLFQHGQDLAGDWKSVPRHGGKRVLERGQYAWGSFAAPYVIEREFEAGGTFRDFLRVNLSRPNHPRVLFARFARGLPATKSSLDDLLAALGPR